MINEPKALFGIEESYAGRFWTLRDYDETQALYFAQQYDLPELLARLLVMRHVPFDAVETYLEPKLSNIPDPSCLKDMDKATERLVKAILEGENIAVFGDYDVDGATSSALIIRFFDLIGKKIRTYIPDREKEGYGPNVNAFHTLYLEGHSVIITVDCGTMSYEALVYAQENNIDVIVVDHHQTGEKLPECHALINPKREDDMSGLDYLAAVGVTFMLLISLRRTLRKNGFFEIYTEPNLNSLLDIVALGTVCDVVPLIGVNRLLVKKGLEIMSQRQNTGLRALSDISKLNSAPTAYDCGFRLGPRINAGGRLGESSIGTKLLSCDLEEEASAMALRMDELNQERRNVSDYNQMIAQERAEEIITNNDGLPDILVVSDERLHAGVIGIVAGRLKEKYHRPVFVIAINKEGIGKGSARSIAGIDLGSLVKSSVNAEKIISGGGHAMAAGITLHKSQIVEFTTYLCEACSGYNFSLPRQMFIDSVISVAGANRDLFESIDKLQPFGADIPEPCFVIPEAQIIYVDTVGDGHVKCTISDENGGRLKAIAFSSVDESIRMALMKKQPMHIVGYLRADNWQGREGVQFMIKDATSVKF